MAECQSSISKPLRSLYGVPVPTEHFDSIKEIANLLVGQTDHREHIADGRRRCAAIALHAWNEASTQARKEVTAVKPYASSATSACKQKTQIWRTVESTAKEIMEVDDDLFGSVMAVILEGRDCFDTEMGDMLNETPGEELAGFYSQYVRYQASTANEAEIVTREAIGCGLVAGFVLARTVQETSKSGSPKVVSIASGWRDKVRRAWPATVAAFGGSVFAYCLGGWRTLAATLALSIVSAAVWNLAKRYAPREEVAHTEPAK